MEIYFSEFEKKGNLFGKKIIVNVNEKDIAVQFYFVIYDGDELSDVNWAQYLQIQNNHQSYFNYAYKSLFEYYSYIVEDRRDMIIGTDEDKDKYAPYLESIIDIEKVVSINTITIKSHPKYGEIIVFDFDCTWDPSHGIGVYFTNLNYEATVEDLGYLL